MQRIWDMANDIKHPGRRRLSKGDLTPLWLENDGLASLSGHSITYAELSDELRNACISARDLADPSAFAAKHLKWEGEGEN